MSKHLLFYDGECGLCDHIVQFVLSFDNEETFLFAPLQGETAEKELKSVPDAMKQADSLILIENYQAPNAAVSIYGKGAFRVAWLLGGWWVLLGWISFLPAFLYDWGYRFVARNRHKIFSKNSCRIPDYSKKNRFLP